MNDRLMCKNRYKQQQLLSVLISPYVGLLLSFYSLTYEVRDLKVANDFEIVLHEYDFESNKKISPMKD